MDEVFRSFLYARAGPPRQVSTSSPESSRDGRDSGGGAAHDPRSMTVYPCTPGHATSCGHISNTIGREAAGFPNSTSHHDLRRMATALDHGAAKVPFTRLDRSTSRQPFKAVLQAYQV